METCHCTFVIPKYTSNFVDCRNKYKYCLNNNSKVTSVGFAYSKYRPTLLSHDIIDGKAC
jgi:hypothetical protein